MPAGRAVVPAEPAAPTVRMASVAPLPDPTGIGQWDYEVRYEVIIAVPMVRQLIEANAAAATTPVSGEKLLKMYDKAFSPIPGVALTDAVALAMPIYARLGIHTGKDHSETYQRPVGRVLANLLCVLAKGGYKVLKVQQGTDGCVLECTLPSDWRSFAGELTVTVHRAGTGATVRAATNIPGQRFDYGKSKKILEQIFAELDRD